jgi:hypothetical protein
VRVCGAQRLCPVHQRQCGMPDHAPQTALYSTITSKVKHGASFEAAVGAVADQRLQVSVWTQGQQLEAAWQREHHEEQVGEHAPRCTRRQPRRKRRRAQGRC